MFHRLYPNMTIEEWEFVQEELQSRPAEIVMEVEDLFNWGSFMQKAFPLTIVCISQNLFLPLERGGRTRKSKDFGIWQHWGGGIKGK